MVISKQRRRGARADSQSAPAGKRDFIVSSSTTVTGRRERTVRRFAERSRARSNPRMAAIERNQRSGHRSNQRSIAVRWRCLPRRSAALHSAPWTCRVSGRLPDGRPRVSAARTAMGALPFDCERSLGAAAAESQHRVRPRARSSSLLNRVWCRHACAYRVARHRRPLLTTPQHLRAQRSSDGPGATMSALHTWGTRLIPRRARPARKKKALQPEDTARRIGAAALGVRG